MSQHKHRNIRMRASAAWFEFRVRDRDATQSENKKRTQRRKRRDATRDNLIATKVMKRMMENRSDYYIRDSYILGGPMFPEATDMIITDEGLMTPMDIAGALPVLNANAQGL